MAPLHLVKLCVGAQGIGDLAAWAKTRIARNETLGRGGVSDHVTRMFPKRRAEILGGGSIYWVIRGETIVRQRILGLETETGADGVARCLILLDPTLVPTQAQPRRAFQGWRYLNDDDAPRDLVGSASGESGRALQASMRAELAALGLL